MEAMAEEDQVTADVEEVQEETDGLADLPEPEPLARNRTQSQRSISSTSSKRGLVSSLSGILRSSTGRKSSIGSTTLRRALSKTPSSSSMNDRELASEQADEDEAAQAPERDDDAASTLTASSKDPASETQRGVLGMLSDVYKAMVGSKLAPANIPLSAKASRGSIVEERSLNTIVNLNVGGQTFSTSLNTLLNGRSTVLREMFLKLEDEDAEPLARDSQGNVFVDHDPKNFATILNFLRANTPTTLPDVGSREWNELRLDADLFGVDELAEQMDALLAVEQARREEEQRKQEEEAASRKATRRKSSTTDLLQKQGRELERMRVELHRLQFEKAKAEAEGLFYANRKMEYAYNLMCVGVTGTGKSSSLNTILDAQVCPVSGSQAQGTRGCQLRDGVIDNTHFISFLDTQGLGADTSVTDEELLEQIMLSAESIRQMGVVNNILISFDLQNRTTPATIANQLTLCELFTDLRRSCFLVFTKWNTNSVLSEWNLPLKKWIRKFRRAKSIDKITADPPSYEEMYRSYSAYLLKSLSLKEDGGAFAKMVTLLCFFESRVIWLYNLDPVQIEDKEDNDLEPYVEYLYNFYRKRALITLKRGSTVIHTKDLAFLHNDEDTMADVAARLISHRDNKIGDLERMGANTEKRKKLRAVFSDMSSRAAVDIEKKVYDVSDGPTTEIFRLLDHPPGRTPDVGCIVS